MYDWRKLADTQRADLLAWRRQMSYPWHSPPHRASTRGVYLLTAACYEHRPVIGSSPARMVAFSEALLECINEHTGAIHAWCVLPNHYHALLSAEDVFAVLAGLGKLHGRTSFAWNGEDACRGRQVWCKAVERSMRSDRHHWATLNYVHNNPIHHGYAGRWQDWPYSSAAEYLSSVGHADAEHIWRAFPVLEYGKGWDDPAL